MLKRSMRIAVLTLPLAMLLALSACGSVGESNTRTRAQETLNRKDPTGHSELLQTRQKSLSRKVSKDAAPKNVVTGMRYVQNTGKSMVRK